jgi:hypothetical protein
MANTLTSLIPDAFAALDVVSRELTGFIPAVARDSSADQVAIGQTLRIPQTPANAGGIDGTPTMAIPSAADQTIGNKSLTITKNRLFPFSWTGEEQKAVSAGLNFLTYKQDQIAQAIRACMNEMESDVALAAKNGASRAYGTAAATPFASDLSDPANIKKILDDNGAPASDRSLVINTTAGAKVRTLTQLTKVNEAGSPDIVRRGQLLDLHNLALRESAQVKNHTKGTGTSYQLNGAHAVGAITLAVDTGSGTIVAGDVITIANGTPADTNKYVVTTALTGGNVIIAAPGLLCAHIDNDAVTVGGSYAGNVAFSRNAILLATRLRELPPEGDLATERETITDPVTGISLELVYYPGFGMGVYMVGCVWGVTVVKPEHTAILLG